jgi:Putative auto-transporter adhesin, head GIN domain
MTRRLMSLTLLAGLVASCAAPAGVIGGGAAATRTFDLQGFTALEACCGFQVVVTGGEQFEVSISANESVLPVLSATVRGDTLHIGLDETQTRSIVTSRLEAHVTLPVLEAVNLSGGARLRLEGTVPLATEFVLRLDGGSRAELFQLHAQNAQVTMTGGSSAELTVSKQLDYDLSGGAHLAYAGEPIVGLAATSGGASASRR